MAVQKALWYSDLHLNFLSEKKLTLFIDSIISRNPDLVWLTGDITTGKKLIEHLELLVNRLPFPIYFIIGNHDYWGSSIEQTHENIRELVKKYPGRLFWVSDKLSLPFSESTVLIGNEGWYDAMLGWPRHLVFTWDWFHISNFRALGCCKRITSFQKVAADFTSKMRESLLSALNTHDHVYAMTHIPPWAEATHDVGTFFGWFWLPYNVSVKMGMMFKEVMEQFPNKKLTVLCGHTHSKKSVQISGNINCHVAGADMYRLDNLIELA